MSTLPPPPTDGRPRKGGGSPGQFADIWRRYRRNKLALVGTAIVGLLIFLAIFEPIITPYNPFEQNLLNTVAPPSAAHPFGTDVLGRDMYSAIIYGAKLAAIVGVVTVAVSLLILVGSILVVRTFGSGVVPVIIALVTFGWATSARLMRGQTLALRESEYVEAARSIGASDTRIIVRHIMPNAIAPVLVYAFTNIGVVIVIM